VSDEAKRRAQSSSSYTVQAVSEVPLSAMLTRALGDLTAEFVTAGAGRGGMPSAPMWFGFLRAMPEADEVTERQLPALTRLSRRAVHQLAGASVRAGWVEVRSGTGVPKALGLSDPGRGAAASWAAIAGSTEQRWCDRVGADRAGLKDTLALVVGQLDLEWPHYPISYGPADSSVTGGRSRPADPGPPRVPAHGQDWAPLAVFRRARRACIERCYRPLLRKGSSLFF
jgi:hypothetical protein